MRTNAFQLSLFPKFTFGYLGCTLADAERALKVMAEEKPDISFDFGDYRLDEIFSIGEDGFATPKSCKSSYTALFFQAADKDKTMQFSNLPDGWMTLGNAIAAKLKTDLYRFSWCDEDDPDAYNGFSYTDCSTPKSTDRVVYAMRDPRWIFCNQGEPCFFEDLGNYKKRGIKDRLNKEIIISYCCKLGIKVTERDFLNPRGIGLRVRHRW